jgi:peptidoglycan/xylan/chitin deacetylase (PgdA/CDA1 family)
LFSDDDLSEITVSLVPNSNESFLIGTENNGDDFFTAYRPGIFPIQVRVLDGAHEFQVDVELSVTASSCVADFEGKNIVLSYDDSPKSDYLMALPVHRELEIPGEVGVWNENVFENSNNPAHITFTELFEMQESGFEMIAHGFDHQPLASATLLRSADSGSTTLDTNIDTVFSRAGRAAYKYVLDDTEKTEIVDILGVESTDGETYIKLANSLMSDFSPYSRLYPEFNGMEREMNQSKEDLSNYGLEVKNFSYPFGLSDDRTVEFARRFGFDTGRDAVPNRNMLIVETLYIDKIFNPFEIQSLDFAYTSNEFLQEIMSSSDEEDQFIILFTHTWDKNYTKQKVRDIAAIAKQNGFNFTTRSQSLFVSCS